jgi:hypothetical protein
MIESLSTSSLEPSGSRDKHRCRTHGESLILNSMLLARQDSYHPLVEIDIDFDEPKGQFTEGETVLVDISAVRSELATSEKA